MPIYEYRCDSCGHEFDALQRLSDDPLKECLACNATAVRRLVSAPVFRLKGNGWYETDFKSDKENKRNLAGGVGSKEAKDTEVADGAATPEKAAGAKAKIKDDKSAGSGKQKDSGATAK